VNITAAGHMMITWLVNVQECLFNETCKYIHHLYVYTVSHVLQIFHWVLPPRLKIGCVIVVAAMSLSYILQVNDPRNSFTP
jgi:hypothetical protein